MSNSSIRVLSLWRQETDQRFPQVRTQAQDVLRSHLPVSLPIYRRLQSGNFLESTVLLTNIQDLRQLPDDSEPWMLLFADRAVRPTTEVLMYGSWESSTDPPAPKIQTKIDELLMETLRTIKSLSTPPSIHQAAIDAQIAAASQNGNEIDSAGYSRAEYISHAVNSSIMLWGAIHQSTAMMLKRLGVLMEGMVVPNHTFVWKVDELHPYDQRPLPGGLRWGSLGLEHFALVRSRTQIPRQDKTLALLPNVAIFEEDSGQPVSWTFIGQDGSLTSLHVEKEWRRKGLARAVSAKAFKEKMFAFWEDGVTRWSHGYVVDGNRESEGMCRSMGGKSDWQAYWLRIDLEAVR